MSLSKDQVYALERISDFLESKEQELILSGSPGSGKSFIVHGMNTQEYKKVLSATTNKAANIIESNTIFNVLGLKLNVNYKTGNNYLVKNKPSIINPYEKTLLVIDECSMISSELYKFIKLEITNNTNLKILYTGDKNQLPPVNDRFSIFNKNIPIVELTTNHRQGDNQELIDLIESYKYMIETGNYSFKNIKSSNCIHVLDAEDMKEQLGLYYLQDKNTKAVAYTNKTVDAYNNYIRDLLIFQGLLNDSNSTEEFPAVLEKVIVNSAFINSSNYIPSDSLVTVTTKSEVPYYNRTTDTTYNVLDLHIGNEKHFTFCRYLNPKDLLKLSKNLKREFHSNRASYHETFGELAQFINIVPRYAQSIHKTQGSTFDSVFIDMADIFNKSKDPDITARLIYVALSRAKEEVFIYGNYNEH